jgi:hypothetical protein
LHKKAFGHLMSFEVLCERKVDDRVLAAAIDCARSNVDNGTLQSDVPLQSVVAAQSSRVDVSRGYIVLNDRELRSASGRARLPGVPLRSVPQIMCASEDNPGELELCYCFRNPSIQYRTADFVFSAGVRMDSNYLQPSDNIWAQQGANYYPHAVRQEREKFMFDQVDAKQLHNCPTLANIVEKLGATLDDVADDMPPPAAVPNSRPAALRTPPRVERSSPSGSRVVSPLLDGARSRSPRQSLSRQSKTTPQRAGGGDAVSAKGSVVADLDDVASVASVDTDADMTDMGSMAMFSALEIDPTGLGCSSSV